MNQEKTKVFVRILIKLIGKAWLAIYAIILLIVGFKLMMWLQPQTGWIVAGTISFAFWMTPPILMALWSDECKKFERERILKEMAENQQTKDCSNRDMGISSSESFLALEELIAKYGAVLESLESAIVSERLLPAPKQHIEDAIITIAKNSPPESSGEIIKSLKVAYASLAHFVSEEDAKIVKAFHEQIKIDAKTIPTDEELIEIANNISDDRAFTILKEFSAEFDRLNNEFDIRRNSPTNGCGRPR